MKTGNILIISLLMKCEMKFWIKLAQREDSEETSRFSASPHPPLRRKVCGALQLPNAQSRVDQSEVFQTRLLF